MSKPPANKETEKGVPRSLQNQGSERSERGTEGSRKNYFSHHRPKHIKFEG